MHNPALKRSRTRGTGKTSAFIRGARGLWGDGGVRGVKQMRVLSCNTHQSPPCVPELLPYTHQNHEIRSWDPRGKVPPVPVGRRALRVELLGLALDAAEGGCRSAEGGADPRADNRQHLLLLLDRRFLSAYRRCTGGLPSPAILAQKRRFLQMA